MESPSPPNKRSRTLGTRLSSRLRRESGDVWQEIPEEWLRNEAAAPATSSSSTLAKTITTTEDRMAAVFGDDTSELTELSDSNDADTSDTDDDDVRQESVGGTTSGEEPEMPVMSVEFLEWETVSISHLAR